MELVMVVGTRPEIIKMSPVIKACEAQGVDYTLIDSKQHYSDNMSSAFYKDLSLRSPDYVLATETGSHAVQLASMLIQLEDILSHKQFAVTLVQGDTNTVLAGALMASRQNIPIAHVEAGLRSHDRTMPEEINRIMVDNIADYLFATSEETAQNLLREGASQDAVWNVGNTIVDATLRGIELAQTQDEDAQRLPSDYLLVTLHRPANVDDATAFRGILAGIEAVMEYYKLQAIFPIHPRTRKRIEEFGVRLPDGMQLTEPLSYLNFLRAQTNATLIMTDSGGIQEEAAIMHVPCVTLRNNTERPETIAVGANILGGTTEASIKRAADRMLARARDWSIPYGDGTAGEQIIRILTEALEPSSARIHQTVGR